MTQKTILRIIMSSSILLLTLFLNACGSSSPSSSGNNGSITNPTPTPTPTQVVTIVTKVYKDFSIKYPSDWTSAMSTDDTVLLADPTGGYTIEVQVYPDTNGAFSAKEAADKVFDPGTLIKNATSVNVASTFPVGGDIWQQREKIGDDEIGGATVKARALYLTDVRPPASISSQAFLLRLIGPDDNFDRINVMVFQPFLKAFAFTYS